MLICISNVTGEKILGEAAKHIIVDIYVDLIMSESFPPTNPVSIVRIILLLSVQDLVGSLLVLVRFFGYYADIEAVRDYIENYPEYFVFNLQEKIYIVKKFVPLLFESAVTFCTSKKSLWKIYEIISHPHVEATVLLMYSIVVLLIFYHHSQVDATVLTSSHWPKSIDMIEQRSEEKSSAITLAANTAQSVLHMKSFPTSSNIVANSNVHRKQKENTEAVTNHVSQPSSIPIVSDQLSFEQQKHQRDVAKVARLQQYPPSPNPLAKKPSRMRTLLRAATATMGLKRTNSMSSITSETSTTSQQTTSQPPVTTTVASPSSSPKNISQPAETSSEVTKHPVASSDSPPQQHSPPQQRSKPKLLLRFDSQDPSTLRVIEDPSPTAAAEYPSTPGIAASPKNLSTTRTATENNNKVLLTPPRPPSSRPIIPQTPVSAGQNNNSTALHTPYSTVSTLTPDSHFLTMLQRHRSSENMANMDIQSVSLDEDAEQETNNKAFDYDASSLSDGTGYAGSDNGGGSGSVMSSQMSGYIDDANAPPEVVLERSIQRPAILIGWRVMIPGYGTGLILSLKKKRFATTKFVVQLENDQIVALKLQRSKDKGNVPFHLLRKVR